MGKEGVHDKTDIARLCKDAYTAVKNWIDVYYKNLAEERMSERSVSYRDPRFPNLSMYGKIDLTERLPDGSIVVTDFKTGTSKTAGVIEKLDDEDRLSSYMRQLAMYSYLINGVEDENVAKSRLLFLEEDSKNKNSLYSTHVTSEQIDLLVRDISDYEKMLTDGSWVTRPCNAKSYGGNNECEYCKRMENIIEEK
jgi:RecB family exonuclease